MFRVFVCVFVCLFVCLSVCLFVRLFFVFAVFTCVLLFALAARFSGLTHSGSPRVSLDAPWTQVQPPYYYYYYYM